MLASLAPALIGLLGVLVGSAISMGANYLLAVRKERAEAAQEEARQAKQIIQISRLLIQEFSIVIASTRSVINSKYWEIDEPSLSYEIWGQYKDVLAAEMVFEDWVVIALASAAVRHIQTFRSRSPGAREVTEDDVKFAEEMLGQLEKGIKVLYRHMGR